MHRMFLIIAEKMLCVFVVIFVWIHWSSCVICYDFSYPVQQKWLYLLPKYVHRKQNGRHVMHSPRAAMGRLRCSIYIYIYILLKIYKTIEYINPSTPRRKQVSLFTEISILFYEGITIKISYKHLAYESVDEKSLSLAMSRKTTKKDFP